MIEKQLEINFTQEIASYMPRIEQVYTQYTMND